MKSSDSLARRPRWRRRWRSASPRAAATTAPSGSGGCVRRAARSCSRQHQRRRRDVPAAGLPGVGRALQGEAGLTVNYQGIGSGGGIAQFTAGTVDFGATDSADEGRGDRGRQEEGRAGPRPDRARRGHRVLQRRGRRARASSSTARRSPTSSSARSRSGTTRRSPRQNAGVKLPERRHHGLPPLRRVGHDEELHRRSSPPTRPTWKSGPGVDKTVKWPTGTGAKGNDGVAACVKQNDGSVGYVEQAYALANNFTFADDQEQGRQLRRADAGVDLGGRRRPDGAGRPALQRDRRARRPGLPDRRRRRSSLVYQDMCKAGLAEEQGEAGQGASSTTRSSDGQGVAQGAAVRAAAGGDPHQAAQTKVDGLTCNGSPIASS